MRFRLWFNVADFIPETLCVDFIVGACAVRVTASASGNRDETGVDGNEAGDEPARQQYGKTVSVARRGAPQVDPRSVRAVRTADGLLVVEGLTRAPTLRGDITTTEDTNRLTTGSDWRVKRQYSEDSNHGISPARRRHSLRDSNGDVRIVAMGSVGGGISGPGMGVVNESKQTRPAQMTTTTATGGVNNENNVLVKYDVKDVEKAVERLKMEV